MKNEFKKIIKNNETRYVLETTTAGATGSGSIASTPGNLGTLKRRIQELKDKISVPTTKPRNPIGMGSNPGRGTQTHANKKRDQKIGKEKHKKPFVDENGEPDHEISMASSELTSIAADAAKLLDIVRQRSEEEGLEAWQQSKITKAADFMNSVLQSIRGDEEHDVGEGYSELDNLKKKFGERVAAIVARAKAEGRPLTDREKKAIAILKGENQGMAEGSEKVIWVEPSDNHSLRVVKSSSPDIKVGEEYDEGDLYNYATNFGYEVRDQGVAEEIGYDQVSPKSARYILGKMEQGVPMSSILDDFPELYRMMEIIAGEQGLHMDDDFEDIEASLYHDLEDIAASEDDDDYNRNEMGEESYQGKGNHRPGWMLKADPKLAQKFKEKEKLVRQREKAYGDPTAGKSVGEGLRDPKDNPCWKGYKPVGTKKKGGKIVPNCVPTNEDAYISQLMAALESKK